MIRYTSFIYILFIVIFNNGCTFYIFDTQYYKAKQYAKKYSATYVVNKNLYNEIMQQRKDMQQNKEQILSFQEKLKRQIKQNKKEWVEQKEYYMEMAHKKSGYYSEKNAQSLFIMDMIEKKFKSKQLLSNNEMYYTMLDNKNIEIPQYIQEQIGGKTTKDMKFKRIIYPQFFYIDDKNEPQIISIGVVYMYVNINKVYSLKEDIDSVFANGEWLYLKDSKVIYLKP